MKKVRVVLGTMAVILPVVAIMVMAHGSKQAEIVPVKPEGISYLK